MKRFYFKHLFLCFCLVASINCFAYDALINGIYYNLSGTNAEVTFRDNSYNSYSGSVNIPASVTYGGTTYNVTSIGNNAFYNCKNLTSVTIPTGVTTIGAYAFQGCVNLSSISFPDGLTSIGTDAFYKCSSLPSLTIPSSVTSINHFTFRGCTSVTSITVASGNPKYDSRNNCNAIIETATNTLITGCQATVIPASVTKIDGWSFCFCSTLTSITIPNSVTTIGDYAFCDCSSLTSITISYGVSTIASNAFNGCKSLTSITLPNSVTSMGTYMFMNCSKLSSITMPNNITKIADWTFYGCSSLTSFDIAESVTSIGSGAFYHCSSLASLKIPEGVTSIGSSAFSSCSGLASINIPGNITTISDYTFYGCSSLTSINIPEGVTSIGKQAFERCTGLSTITIPENVTSIGSGVFSYNGLTSISVASGNTHYDSRNNCNAIIETATNTMIAACQNTVIPTSVTKLEYAFNGCTGLTSITIPESVTCIGDYAFHECENLTSVNIPDDVTSIGEYAFYGCDGLTSITIPNKITTISKRSFAYCHGLTSVTIPNSVTSIGEGAFMVTVKMRDIYCYATSVPETEGNAFDYTTVSSVTLHVPEASIGAYSSTSPWSEFGSIVALVDDVPPQPQRQYRYYNLVITGVQESDRMLQFSEFDILDNTFNEVEDLTVYAGTEGGEEDESWPNVADNDVHTKFCGDLNGYAYFMFDAQNSIEPYGYRFYTADDSSLYLGRNPSSWKLYGSNTKLTDPNSTDWVLIDERNNDMTLPSIDYAPSEFYFKDTPNQLNLSQHSATLVSGEELQLQVRDKLNAIQDMTLQWTSTNRTVAIVNNQGLVVARGIGTADIIVSFAEDSSVRDTCTVTVVASLPGYRYYQFAIEAIGGGDIVQLSEFDLIDENGNEVSPLITYAYAGSSFDGESQENLFDNDIETKYCGGFSSETPVYIFIDAGRHIIPSGYRMVTGGDADVYPERNPVSWSLLGSNSKSSRPNDTVWTLLDHRENDKSLGAEALATYDFVITPSEEPDQQCAKPTIGYSNGKLTFKCDTEDVTFLSTITDADISSYSSSEVQLGVTYNIMVYAKKTGYKDSEVTTATLCWIDVAPQTEGITDEDAVTEIKAVPVLIQTQGNTITVQGPKDGTEVSLYSVTGMKLDSVIACKGFASLSSSLLPGSVAIVKIGDKTVKVLIK